MNQVKLAISCVLSFTAGIFGGWTHALTTLCIFMLLDWTSGMVLAAVFHKSTKTENGKLESKASLKGICKKIFELTLVIVAANIDNLIGGNYVKDAVVIILIINESISIVENIGLMGVPIPKVITNAIEILKHKDDEEGK